MQRFHEPNVINFHIIYGKGLIALGMTGMNVSRAARSVSWAILLNVVFTPILSGPVSDNLIFCQTSKFCKLYVRLTL